MQKYIRNVCCEYELASCLSHALGLCTTVSCCTPRRHNWLQPLCCTEKRRHVQIYNYQRNGEVEYAPYLILISLWVASAKFPLKSLVSSLPTFTFYGFFDSFGSKSKPKLNFINCNCYIVLLDFCRIILSACILIPILIRELLAALVGMLSL